MEKIILMSQYHCKVQQQRLQTQAALLTQVKTLNHYLKIVEMMVMLKLKAKVKNEKGQIVSQSLLTIKGKTWKDN